MIYLAHKFNGRYWVLDNKQGANISTDTSETALHAYLESTFRLTKYPNNYTIKCNQVLSHGEKHATIVASAKTTELLVQNFPEFFI